MRKLFIILFCLINLNISSQILEITNTVPGNLSTLLGNDEDFLISISALKINGIINDEDFKIISKLIHKDYVILYKCSYLDLSDCEIVGDTLKESHIGMDSFLEYLNLPKSLKAIGKNVQCINTNLKTLIIYEGLEYIGPSAFAWINLSEITLPSTLRYLGSRSFTSCLIENINLNSINPPEIVYQYDNYGNEIGYWGRGYRDRQWQSTCKIHCPIGSKVKYREHKYFGQFSYIIQDLNVISNNNQVKNNIDFVISYGKILSDNKNIQVYTITGELVKWNGNILKQGIYILKLGNISKKIIIK